MDDLDVEILSPAAIRITWKPPSSMNGIILNYYITLIKIIQDKGSIVNEWELQFSDNHLVEVWNLGLCIYECTSTVIILCINFRAIYTISS